MNNISELIAKPNLASWREVPICAVCGRWNFPRQAWMHVSCVTDSVTLTLAERNGIQPTAPSVTKTVTKQAKSVTVESLSVTERNALTSAQRQKLYRDRKAGK